MCLIIAELSCRENVGHQPRVLVKDQGSDVDHVARLDLVLLLLLLVHSGLRSHALRIQALSNHTLKLL